MVILGLAALVAGAMALTQEIDEEYRCDMTPMIDVVFLLIIFFLCIEFKTLEARLDAFLPTDRGSAPTVAKPKEQLVVRVHVDAPGTEIPSQRASVSGRPPRYRLEGHRIRLEVGPVRCQDLAAGRRELERLADNPKLLVPADDGGLERMACVIEGLPGTRYNDIAHTADIVRAAGFDRVHFGGGLGPR
ncbi:MAG: ExbD/TolR family protein [Planctomycetota bacterium]